MTEKPVWEARDSGLWNNRRSCIVFVAGSDVEAKRLESYMNDAVDSAVALTSERDKAVRVAAAYREALGLVKLLTDKSGLSSVYRQSEAGEDIADLHEMVSEIIDALTQGGTSEPLKEQE